MYGLKVVAPQARRPRQEPDTRWRPSVAMLREQARQCIERCDRALAGVRCSCGELVGADGAYCRGCSVAWAAVEQRAARHGVALNTAWSIRECEAAIASASKASANSRHAR
jgi:hypothetical protein